MSIVRTVVLAALVMPCMAFATNTFTVTTSSCSGSLVTSFANGVSLACDGNYSLSGGLIESSQSIFLSATGSISLIDLTLSAPILSISSGSSLTLGNGVILLVPELNDAGQATSPDSPSLTLQVGGVQQSIPEPLVRVVGIDGATVSSWTPDPLFLSNVPEPNAVALLMGGLLSLGFVMARERSKS